MKDWKQAVITWEKRRKEETGNLGHRRGAPAHDPSKLKGFKNALDNFDDDGNYIGPPRNAHSSHKNYDEDL